MAKRITRAALSIAALLIAPPVNAQTDQRSAIEGIVTDPQGAMIPGASVTLSGDRLIGGTRTAGTDAFGHFRFVELLPGPYDAQAAAPGFQTVKRSNILLPVETTYTVPFQLQVAGVVQSVEVTSDRALIDVRSSGSPTIFAEPLLHDLPTERSLDGVLGLTPGVTTPTPLYSIGGQVAFGGTQMSGNVLAVDGVNLNGHETGQQASDAHYNWFEQVQVSSLGAPAEYGTFTGAMANGVLRSGSNRVSGMGEYLTRRPNWTANNLGDLPDHEQQLLPPITLLSWWDANGQVGAPIVRDRLWVFGGTSGRHHTYRSYGYPGPGETDERTSRTIVKMDASPLRSLLQGFITRDATDTVGLGLSHWETAESRPDTANRTHAWNLRGNAALTPATMLTMKISGYTAEGQAEPHPPATMDGPSPSKDRATNMNCCNSWWSDRHESSTVLSVTASHYRVGGFGRHDLEGGLEYEFAPHELRDGIPTGRRFTTDNGVLVGVEEWAGDHTKVTARHGVLYVQDRWTLNDRITLEPGVRAEFNRGTLTNGTSPVKTSPIALRLGVAWDVTGKLTTVLRVHYGRLHDPLYTDVYSYTDKGTHSPHIFYDVQPDGEFVESFRYVDEIPLEAPRYTIKQSHVDQWVAGVEHALGPNTTVEARYVGRRFDHFIGWLDPRLSEWTPHEVQDPGPDGDLGTSDDGGMATIYQSYPNRGWTDIALANPDGAYRHYHGVQFIATRRFADRWQYQVSYSWSRSNGTAGNEYGTNATNWSMNLVGYGANANKHAQGAVPPMFDYSEFKAVGSYRAPWLGGWTTGAVFRWHNGTRWNRVFWAGWQYYPGVPGEPVGTRRTPNIGGLDLRVEKTFGLPRDGQLGLYVDFFNLTNVGRATGYNNSSGPDFEKVTSWTDPRTGQLGVRYSF